MLWWLVIGRKSLDVNSDGETVNNNFVSQISFLSALHSLVTSCHFSFEASVSVISARPVILTLEPCDQPVTAPLPKK